MTNIPEKIFPGRLVLAAAAIWASGAVPGIARAGDSAIDPAAYARLMEDNRELRRRIDLLTEERGAIAAERAELIRQVADLEQRLTQLTLALETVRDIPAARADDTGALRQALETSERERTGLMREIERLRDSERRLLAQAAAPPDARIAPESDLFRALDRESVRLREEIARLDGELHNTRRQRDTALELLEEAAARLQSQRGAAAEVEARALRMLTEFSSNWDRRAADYERRLAESDAATQRLRDDLSRRAEEAARPAAAAAPREEAALASRIPADLHADASLFERPRRPAEPAAAPPPPNRRRDMHYNMGVMFAREGRALEAEREYLAALALDPRDAGTHYNLGILYENSLGDRRRAARHYREYLELRPDSARAPAVRSWIMTLESGR